MTKKNSHLILTKYNKELFKVLYKISCYLAVKILNLRWQAS